MLQSVIFRTFLFIYSLFIIQQNNSLLPRWVYYLIGVIYLVVYLFLKKNEMPLSRLFIDFIFINIIVWGKDVKTPITFLFILLPMINAINFSGKQTHNIILLFLSTGTFIFNMKTIEGWIFLPLISLWLLYLLSWVRKREWDTINSIVLHIDTYFINKEQIERPHLIYNKIIADINKFFFYKQNSGMRKICAYTMKGYSLWLINSSSFMWQRTKFLTESQIHHLKRKKMLLIRNQSFDEYLFYIEQGDLEYVFTCETKHNSVRLYYRFVHIMFIAFTKVALLLNSEYRISELRHKKFDEIKNSVLYVNKAVKIMHFIRNRMTPLANIITYGKKINTIESSVRAKMEKRMEKEFQQADSDLKEILTTANYLLDKSNKPFIEPEMKDVHVSKLFIVLSEIVERILEGTVEIDKSILNDSVVCNTIVNTSLIEFKILLTDWINNIQKYKKKYYRIRMSIEQNELIISFQNDYNINETNIQHLIQDLNSKEKDAVLEGKNYGHGIHIIKSIASDLKIEIKAKKENDINNGSLIHFELKIKTYEKKDSNI